MARLKLYLFFIKSIRYEKPAPDSIFSYHPVDFYLCFQYQPWAER